MYSFLILALIPFVKKLKRHDFKFNIFSQTIYPQIKVLAAYFGETLWSIINKTNDAKTFIH